MKSKNYLSQYMLHNFFILLLAYNVKVKEYLCPVVDNLCNDWTGKTITHELKFECTQKDCQKRFPLKMCYGQEKYVDCNDHDIDLKSIREKFGKYALRKKLDIDWSWMDSGIYQIKCQMFCKSIIRKKLRPGKSCMTEHIHYSHNERVDRT